MTTKSPLSTLLGACLAGLLVMACSPMKEPAQAALADATSVLQKVAPDAEKYAPEQYAQVKEQVTGMQAAFDKQDYQAVLNTVHKLAPALKTLAETVANRKRDAAIALKAQWTSLSADLPKSLAALEARLAEVRKTHRLPKGVSKDALPDADAAIADAKLLWSDAQGALTAGNVEDAVAKG